MKKFISTVAIACMALSAAAQTEDIFESSDNQPYFGARLSLDIAIPGDAKVKDSNVSIDLMNPGAGFSIGGIYNYTVWKNLYVEPGLNLYYHTYKLDYKNDVSLVPGEFEKGSLREFGFNIPIMVGYKFNFDTFSLSLFTGPEFKVGLSGKYHWNTTVSGVEMSGSESMYSDFNRADVQWRLGVGATFSRHYYISFSGAAGMCNWAKDSVIRMHRNDVKIALGYNF